MGVNFGKLGFRLIGEDWEVCWRVDVLLFFCVEICVGRELCDVDKIILSLCCGGLSVFYLLKIIFRIK